MSTPYPRPEPVPRNTIFDIEAASLQYAGTLLAGGAWSMPTESHAIWEFIFFQRGCGRVVLPHAILRPQQYYLVVLPPGLSHAEFSDPIDPEETLWFGVDVPGAAPLDACLLLPDPRGEFRWLCERIVQEYQVYGMTALASTYTRAFLELLERAWDSGTPVQHDAIDTAVQYLHANYAQPIALGTLAALVHLSESHFVHRFTARLGISPIRYLQRVRIDAARRLLATTELPVSEIAAQVGFADPHFFSRTFRTIAGASPSTYRTQAQTTK